MVSPPCRRCRQKKKQEKAAELHSAASRGGRNAPRILGYEASMALVTLVEDGEL